MLRFINLCLTLNEAIFIWGCRKKKNPYSYPRILLTSQKDGKIVGRDPGIFPFLIGRKSGTMQCPPSAAHLPTRQPICSVTVPRAAWTKESSSFCPSFLVCRLRRRFSSVHGKKSKRTINSLQRSLYRPPSSKWFRNSQFNSTCHHSENRKNIF